MDNVNNSTAEHTKSNNKLKVKEKKMKPITEKNQMPERVKNYKTFSQLSVKAQKKAKREEKLFCSKFNFAKKDKYVEENLYHECGKLACMTVTERKSWYK